MSEQQRTVFEKGCQMMIAHLRRRVETCEGLLEKVVDILVSLDEELQSHHNLLLAMYGQATGDKEVSLG